MSIAEIEMVVNALDCRFYWARWLNININNMSSCVCSRFITTAPPPLRLVELTFRLAISHS